MLGILRQEYGRPAVWRMYGEDTDVLVERLRALPAEERAVIRAVTGHIEFGLHRLFTGPTRYVTMLRDPIDRIISQYHYMLRIPPEQRGLGTLDGVHSLEDYVTRSRQAPVFNNEMVRLLGGDIREPALPATRHTLERAKRNLERFVVVGLQERFDESLLLMRRALGWGWPAIRHLNVTGNRPQVETIDADTRDLIARRNDLDLELYEYGRACFERQLAAYGPDLGEDLAALRGPRAADVTDDGLNLSAVVMGYRNEATIVAAVRSLLDQAGDARMEIIAVVSGDDRSAELLREHTPAVRVVASPTRLLPGGARNVGLEHSGGEIVAFLAGDCVAAPGWVTGRFAAHRAGH